MIFMFFVGLAFFFFLMFTLLLVYDSSICGNDFESSVQLLKSLSITVALRLIRAFEMLDRGQRTGENSHQYNR